MLTIRTPVDLVAELEQPTTYDGWWLVDWPDGRQTYVRRQPDAAALAARLNARFHVPISARHVTTILG